MAPPLDLLPTRQPRQLAQSPAEKPLLLCFSHLRWDFVHQRPQHLLTHGAASYRIFFFEAPEILPDGATGLAPFRSRQSGPA